MVFGAATALMRQMASKGSITVDGVSLTLVDVDDQSFSVALIPHTLQHTTLGNLQVGDTCKPRNRSAGQVRSSSNVQQPNTKPKPKTSTKH